MPSLRCRCWSYMYVLSLISFLMMSVLPVAYAGPGVQILQPQQGQVVSGVIWIDIAYSTNTAAPITTLEIYVDNELVRKSNLASPELSGKKSFEWDFSFAAATAHSISAKAVDNAGASGSATISVTVRQAQTNISQPSGAVDQIPPTVNIYYPAQGAKLAGLVEIRAEARDNAGVEQVYFYIDGRLHKMIYNSPPYYDQWDTSKLPDGRHILSAAAVDSSNNEARSAEVTVFVENHAMTRMQSTSAASPVVPQTVTSAPPVVAAAPQVAAAPPVISAPSATTAVPATPPALAPTVIPVVPASVPPTTPRIAVNDFGQAPVATNSSTNLHQGGLAVATRPAATPPVISTSAPVAAVPAPAAQRPTTVATAAVSAPIQSAKVVRPALTPSVSQISSSAITAQTLTLADTSATQVAALPATPRVSTPDLISRTAPSNIGTQFANTARTSTAATLARVDLATSGPRVSVPQRISPLPGVATAAASDKTIPTFRAITEVVPGDYAFVAPTARVTKPAMVSTLPATATTAVAAAPGQPAMLAMLPGTEAPKLLGGNVSNPGNPELGNAVTSSKMKDIAIVYEGKTLELLASPETVGGIATAPLREIFEETDGVLYWFPITKEVRAINNTTDLHLTIGDPEVDVNGVTQTTSVAPYIKCGRTMLPLQFVADMLDMTIAYESTTQQIVITSNEF